MQFLQISALPRSPFFFDRKGENHFPPGYCLQVGERRFRFNGWLLYAPLNANVSLKLRQRIPSSFTNQSCTSQVLNSRSQITRTKFVLTYFQYPNFGVGDSSPLTSDRITYCSSLPRLYVAPVSILPPIFSNVRTGWFFPAVYWSGDSRVSSFLWFLRGLIPL